MRRLFITLFVIFIYVGALCQNHNTRQRNIIYIFDCTQSMMGTGDTPNIWAQTKQFLKSELEKEAMATDKARIRIIPFQDKCLNTITVDPHHIDWPDIEKSLDSHIQSMTYTNICDAWLNAEKLIDETKDNYIILMTDGVDNIGGTANIANRQKKLKSILENFCNKYHNTKGFYVTLTRNATISSDILQVIEACDDIYIVNASEGIRPFGGVSQNEIQINTRDLPRDINLGFSNTGTYSARLIGNNNDMIDVSIKDNKIENGRLKLHIKSKINDIKRLNELIGQDKDIELSFSIESDDISISNPEIKIILKAADLRTLNITELNTENCMVENVDRVKPFLWVRTTDEDTLKWNLKSLFNETALKDKSRITFKVSTKGDINDCKLLVNNEPLSTDSLIVLNTNDNTIIELIIPSTEQSGDIEISIVEVNIHNLDRINDSAPDNFNITLIGKYDTHTSYLEIIVWSLLGLIFLALLIWFLLIKKAKYPTFKRGIITINNPYYATIRLKGFRKVVFTPVVKSQSVIDKIFKGKILYHPNSSWPCEAEINPVGRKSMRFQCSSNRLISDPIPTWVIGESYKIIDVDTNKPIIEIKVDQ